MMGIIIALVLLLAVSTLVGRMNMRRRIAQAVREARIQDYYDRRARRHGNSR